MLTTVVWHAGSASGQTPADATEETSRLRTRIAELESEVKKLNGDLVRANMLLLEEKLVIDCVCCCAFDRIFRESEKNLGVPLQGCRLVSDFTIQWRLGIM